MNQHHLVLPSTISRRQSRQRSAIRKRSSIIGLLFIGLILLLSSSYAFALTIEEAVWDANRGRLTVSGTAGSRDRVTVVNAFDTGQELGDARPSRRGDHRWSVRERDPSPVPCRVLAIQDGASVIEDVRNAPDDCAPQPPGDNQAPIANANGPYNGTTGVAVDFSSDGSNDPDGNIVSFDWDFGDRNSSTAANPTHTYASAGTFTVTLTVSDNDGATDTDTTTAVISDQPPPPPNAPNVSINSTAQNCGTADISGNNIACDNNPVPEQPITGNTAGHSIVAINDLGMHCGDLDTRISSILPPFQVLLAQVLQKGEEPRILGPNQTEVFYSAASNPDDPILGDDNVFRGLTADGSVYRTNFWDFPVPNGTYDAFYPAFNPFDPTFQLTPLTDVFGITYDVGLPVPNVEHLYIGPDGIVNSGDEFLAAAIQDMPGIAAPYASADPLSNVPQHVEEHLGDKPFFVNFPFGYVANDVNWFEGAGIPFAAYDDFGRENAYPLVRVEARSQGGNTLASVDTVLPISGEASCKNCHASSLDDNFGPTRTTDPEDELIAAGLPVVTSETDPMFVAGQVPVDVAVEWATDINVLRLHDVKHGANYADFCDGSVAPCPTDPCTISAANPNGSASCLTNQALVQEKPVVCQVCHYTPALDLAQLGPLAGPPGTIPDPNNINSLANGRNQVAHQSNSRVMHSHHGQFASLFPEMPEPVQDGNGGIRNQDARLEVLEQTCYQCHPGTNVQCLRGAMFDGGMLCNDCHGGMEAVGADFTAGVSPQNPGAFTLGGNFYDPDDPQPRVPWANEPGCGSCHTGDALDNLADMQGVIANQVDAMGNTDNIRLRQAFRSGDAKATPIVPTNTLFAENPIPASFNGFTNPGAMTINTNDAADGAATPKLYRVSTGHGGVFCEGCHGATHAEFDSDGPISNDDVTSNQLQGHTGTIIECSTCHANAMNNEVTLDGPHGMHPVGGENIEFVDGGHEELVDDEDNPTNCQVCHGPGGIDDNVGSVLSVAKVDRDFRGLENGGEVAKGTPIGCTTCHD